MMTRLLRWWKGAVGLLLWSATLQGKVSTKLPSWLRKTAGAAFLSATLFSPLSHEANAADSQWDDRHRLASEVWRKVDELFYDRTFNGQDWFKLRQEVVKRTYTSDTELHNALKQMISKLGDKYTKYLTPAQYSALLSSSQAELVGLGVELGTDDTGRVTILRVEEGSPAQYVNLRAGDIVVNVEGQDAKALSPEEVAALLRGTINTKVSVRVLRGNSEVKDITAERQPIKLKGVSYNIQTLNNDKMKIGVIRIRSFSTSTLTEATLAMEKLHQQGDLDAIVIDLRDNGGGVLQGAVETANLFLNPGKIVVFTVGKDGLAEVKQTLPSVIVSEDTNLPDLSTKLLLLINSNTASAAEAFSAALQENNHRATLIGEKSFGKGIIQTLLEVEQGGLAVTVARYETPLHHNIHKIGIVPDITLSTACTAPFETVVSTCLNDVLVQKK